MSTGPGAGPGRRVALLRGVNVGGVTVKSGPLAEVFRSLGFQDVTTVLASGNVLFSGGGSDAQTKPMIEKALADAFGYDAWIILTDQAALRSVVDGYPFDELPERQPYVVFASENAPLDALLHVAGADPGRERVARGDGVLYWEVTRGMSTDTPVAKELAKKRHKQTTTTRNLRTLRKLLL